MKLESFRILDYKSIIDSKECYLSSDNITVLAGQNEAGKSSILEALRDYENNKYDADTLRYDGGEAKEPQVICKYIANKDEIQTAFINELSDEGLSKLYPALAFLADDKEFISVLKGITNFSIKKTFKDDGHTIDLIGESYEQISLYIDSWITNVGGPALEKKNKELIGASFAKKIAAKLVQDAASIINEEIKDESLPKDELNKNKEEDIGVQALPGIDEFMRDVANILWRHTPVIIFFSDFLSVLPEKILISDLDKKEGVDGIQAVNNIQSFLQTDFRKFSKQSDSQVEVAEENYELKLSKDFNSKWKQRVGDSKGTTISIKYYQGELKRHLT